MSPTREQLLGYLLEALEPAEYAAVERELKSNPRLRRELSLLESSLLPLGFPNREDEASLDGPPIDLAERTLQFLDDAREDVAPRPMPARVVVTTFTREGPAEGNRTRRADVLVAACVGIAAVMLLFPAVAGMRRSSQIAACRENLRQLGDALVQYGELSPDRRIPAVPAKGNRAVAGVYAPLLWDGQLLDYMGRVVCPASPLMRHPEAFQLPTLDQIDRAAGETLVKFQRGMGGSYGYNLGYVEGEQYRSPQLEGRSYYPVMSDAPSIYQPGRKTENHFGRGQNFLYADNHVRFVIDLADDLLDDPYLNRSGFIAAGEDPDDVVLGESSARPFPSLPAWPK